MFNGDNEQSHTVYIETFVRLNFREWRILKKFVFFFFREWSSIIYTPSM